ncbi:MAG: DUF1922 domain-containing protein [Methanomicrobiaceae archaeon]|uniref:DUF1922 domain-containing protein n=1 Tax=hydrocarbon metagenome TaxID=938273 RepID=A0A0W8FJK5_9ZZZZ|nr:DUF1922 domain-containing protein [Methanomicrobiaceae archaeon]MDD5420096.1 DUF1922 domain-containing protein [Methanomicrobiaceae archaeon]
MYLVIRCPGCRTFTYVDSFQRWKLCHVCGEAIDVNRVPVYLDVNDHRDAETVVNQLQAYLQQAGKRDLSAEELEKLRIDYANWVRSRL